jgi:hypothetical protein
MGVQTGDHAEIDLPVGLRGGGNERLENRKKFEKCLLG